MKKVIPLVKFLLVFFVLGGLAALGQQTKQTLKNEDIVKMSKTLTDAVIINTIQQYPSDYDTSPDGLIELKKQGVSDAVILAVSKAGSNKTAAQNNSGVIFNPDPAEEIVNKIKPFPIDDFIFEFNICQSSGGDSLTCWFSITNEGQERDLTITLDSFIIVDYLSDKRAAADATIGDKFRKYKLETSVRETIPVKAPINGSVKFENISSQAKIIKLLRISCFANGKNIRVEFRDIIIDKKNQPTNSIKYVARRVPPIEDGLSALSTPIEDGLSALSSSSQSELKKGTSFPIKYMRKNFSPIDQPKILDLCSGILTVGKDFIEIQTDSNKSFQKIDCIARTYKIPKERIYELKDDVSKGRFSYKQASDYIYIKFGILGNNKEDEKEFYLYPTDATIVYGTNTFTITGGVVNCPKCPAIVCKNCEVKFTSMKKMLAPLLKKAKLKYL